MKNLRGKLTYANVVSTLCLFLLVGGATAFAATKLAKNSVGTKQLKKNSVTSAKIRKDAVTGNKVKESTLGQVPSAATAGSSTSAQTAQIAATATNAQALDGRTAAELDDGPLAFARVKNSANGAVDTVDEANSQGIADANVTHPSTGNYCFYNLGFTPHVALVTTQFFLQKVPTAILPPSEFNVNCSGSPDMSVQVVNSDGVLTPTNTGFDILIY
jgi:hypothetical protein